MVWACLVFAATRGYALAPVEGRPPKPWVTLPLESLGFYGVSRPFLEAGASMLTVHFVDDEHVLITHSLRTLVPRRKEATENEDARLVGADLVALPSGKVLAHTVWHTHDHGRYLWNLGRGRFLLRIGKELSVIAPLSRLATKEPFEPLKFPDRGGSPAAVMLSPDGDLLTVETQVREHKPKRLVFAPTAEDREEERRAHEVVIDFYRLSGDGSEASPLRVSAAGALRAPEAIALPLDADGYLWIGESRRGQWPVVFHEFGGKAESIAPVLSSCVPRLQLVSRSQFLAFACQGTEDRVKLEAFGFDGHENWEESLSASVAPSTFAFAPEAGRFALSRIVESFVPNTDPAAASSTSAQEIRVYQTESGDLLLRIQATPAVKAPENFDLSADGRLFAVVRGAKLELYELPKASSRDLKDLAEARQFAPPPGSGPVHIGVLTGHEAPAAGAAADTAGRSVAPANPAAGATAGTGTNAVVGAASGVTTTTPGPVDPAPAASTPSKTAAAATAPTDTAATAGDTTGERRRPPTLLNPGKKQEYGKPK